MSVITAAVECHMTGATERVLATTLIVDSERHQAFIKDPPSPSSPLPLHPAKSEVGQRKTAGHCASLHPCLSTFYSRTPASARPPVPQHAGTCFGYEGAREERGI